ncbi:DUF3987 domain-containing protein [Metallibacterium scheffleri]|uniref:DUF3987 domain-containing protein n=1 Tax=Metallibacterium scheffleri TaxID=993689 RepID=A0A4S3KKN9_9GAMM|nr:DUF3987 domain-containing protein [Metallibacterium scheffleri]THD09405.1 hypothetical protein B1806_11055 [Metallibacterium scheffleri]
MITTIAMRRSAEPFAERLPIAQALERAAALLLPEATAPETVYPLAALGPLADAARDLAAGAQVDVAMAGQSLLAAAALLTQSTANVRSLDGAIKPLALYALTIANSGDGKDSGDRVALHPVHEFQREAGRAYGRALAQVASEKATRKKNDPPIEKPIPPFRLCADATIEGLRRSFDEGVASQGLFSTEGGAVLAGHGMTPENRTKTAATLCGLWDRGHLSVVRAGEGRTERYGIRLSSHLLLQPAALGDVLADESLAGIGFWPRFLLAWPAPLAPRKFRPWRPNASAAVMTYTCRANELLDRPVPDDCDALPIIEPTPEATAMLAAFFERMEVEARRGDLRDVRPFALRATELACRVAGVLAAWTGADKLEAENARDGIAVAAYSLDTWQAALAGKADPAPGWAMTLYRWLAARAEPTLLRDLTKLAPASVRPSARRDQAIDRLKSAGLVDVTDGSILAQGVTHARQ